MELPLVDNPPLKIVSFSFPDGRTIHVVQDGVLLTGTKQRVAARAVKKFLGKDSPVKVLQYTGSWNGFGAIATAYAAYRLHLKAAVYLTAIPTGSTVRTPVKTIEASRQIRTLKALGAAIKLFPEHRLARNAQYAESDLPTKTKGEWQTKPEYFNVPMGLNDDEGVMIKMLGAAIKKAAVGTVVKSHKTTRIWVVCGTGGIMRSINVAFPKALLFVLFTGGGMYKANATEWAKTKKNITILEPIPGKNYSEERKQYYESVAGYDDQIWPHIKAHAIDGDIIWNVASD